MGVTLFDASDVYGTGESERLLGKALGAVRADVVIATKFGYTYDQRRRAITGTDASPPHIRNALSASLKRLGTDYVEGNGPRTGWARRLMGCVDVTRSSQSRPQIAVGRGYGSLSRRSTKRSQSRGCCEKRGSP